MALDSPFLCVILSYKVLNMIHVCHFKNVSFSLVNPVLVKGLYLLIILTGNKKGQPRMLQNLNEKQIT